MNKKIIYIAHPISGAVFENIAEILRIFRNISLENDVVPIAPYVAPVLALKDYEESERAIGISQNDALFNRGAIDELWVYGDTISKGVQAEIDLARELGIHVLFKEG